MDLVEGSAARRLLPTVVPLLDPGYLELEDRYLVIYRG